MSRWLSHFIFLIASVASVTCTGCGPRMEVSYCTLTSAAGLVRYNGETTTKVLPGDFFRRGAQFAISDGGSPRAITVDDKNVFWLDSLKLLRTRWQKGTTEIVTSTLSVCAAQRSNDGSRWALLLLGADRSLRLIVVPDSDGPLIANASSEMPLGIRLPILTGDRMCLSWSASDDAILVSDSIVQSSAGDLPCLWIDIAGSEPRIQELDTYADAYFVGTRHFVANHRAQAGDIRLVRASIDSGRVLTQSVARLRGNYCATSSPNHGVAMLSRSPLALISSQAYLDAWKLTEENLQLVESGRTKVSWAAPIAICSVDEIER